MKVWIKYLLGVAVGFAAAVLIPFENGSTSSTILYFLTELFTRFGHYIVLPLVFFTTIVFGAMMPFLIQLQFENVHEY